MSPNRQFTSVFRNLLVQRAFKAKADRSYDTLRVTFPRLWIKERA